MSLTKDHEDCFVRLGYFATTLHGVAALLLSDVSSLEFMHFIYSHKCSLQLKIGACVYELECSLTPHWR